MLKEVGAVVSILGLAVYGVSWMGNDGFKSQDRHPNMSPCAMYADAAKEKWIKRTHESVINFTPGVNLSDLSAIVSPTFKIATEFMFGNEYWCSTSINMGWSDTLEARRQEYMK